MIKKIIAGLLFVASSLFSAELDIKKHTWHLVSNELNTDINTSTFDDKNIKALWRYKDSGWNFYSSDTSIQDSVSFDKIDSIKSGEAFWVYSEVDNNISLEENVEDLYFVPEITSNYFKELYLSMDGENIIFNYNDENNNSTQRTLQKMDSFENLYGYNNSSTDEQIILNLNNLGFVKMDLIYNSNANMYFLSTKDKICNDERNSQYIEYINLYNKKQITCD